MDVPGRASIWKPKQSQRHLLATSCHPTNSLTSKSKCRKSQKPSGTTSPTVSFHRLHYRAVAVQSSLWFVAKSALATGSRTEPQDWRPKESVSLRIKSVSRSRSPITALPQNLEGQKAHKPSAPSPTFKESHRLCNRTVSLVPCRQVYNASRLEAEQNHFGSFRMGKKIRDWAVPELKAQKSGKPSALSSPFKESHRLSKRAANSSVPSVSLSLQDVKTASLDCNGDVSFGSA